MKNVYFNSNDSLVTVTSPNQTGETLPRDYRKGTINSLCRNLTLLLAVLVMSMANVGMAWGAMELANINFKSWTPQSISAGSTVNGCYFKSAVTITAAKGATFGGNATTSSNWVAIPLSGINGSITITLTHASSRPQWKNYFKGLNAAPSSSDLSSNPSSVGDNTRPGSNTTTSSWTINTDKLYGVFYVGKGSNGLNDIYSITITTPDWTYYYRGADNSWGGTEMTKSSGGFYSYKSSTTNDHQFKIAKSADGWDYNHSYVDAGYLGTSITTIGDYSSDNCYIWSAPASYYIIVFRPGSPMNTTANPKICASATLPAEKFTISFNNGGGSGSMSSISNVLYGSDKAITANTFTKDGYRFTGWHANVDVKVGGATKTAGTLLDDEVTIQEIKSDITLTAQWEVDDGCNKIFWFANSADATTNGVTNNTTTFSGVDAGTTSVSGSITIDGKTYTATGRGSNNNTTITFTVPANKVGTLYGLANSSGSSARTLTLTNTASYSETQSTSASSSTAGAFTFEDMPAGSYSLAWSGNGAENMLCLKLCDAVSCTAPTGLAAGSTTAKGTTFTVTDGEGTNNYEFYVSTSSTAPTAGSTATYTATSTTKTVTNLVAGTTYYAWVRSNCSGTKSDWTALGSGGTFTTSTVTVTHTLTNVTKTSGAATAGGSNYTAVYAAVSGYSLPTPTVTIDGNTATSGTDYTWTTGTGTLTIPANKINGNIVITLNSAAAAPSSVAIGDNWLWFAGETMTLTAIPTGGNGPVTYQWYYGGKADGNAIEGATNATFSKTCAFSDAGSYYCKVTCGGTESTWGKNGDAYEVKIPRLYVKTGRNDGVKSDYGNVDFTRVDASTATASISLGANWDYCFNIADGCGHYYGNAGTMQYNSYGPWVTNVNNQDCGLRTTNGATYVFTINYSNWTQLTTTVTFPSSDQAAGKVIYFDNNDRQWSNLHYRIGRGDHTQADALTLVPGTANLYKYTTVAYNNFAGWHIANNAGWIGSNSIYRTYTNGDEYSITYATAHEGGAVTQAAVTVTPTTSRGAGADAGVNDNCTFYNYEITTGMKTHNVSITPPSYGTLTVNYVDVSGTAQAFSSGNRDLAHTCIITVTAVPGLGYQEPATISINGSSYGNRDPYTLTGDIVVSAVFPPAVYTVTLNTNGGTINAGNVTSYTYGTGATLPTNVTKDGFTFDGWYDNSGLTGSAVTTISTTATGNKEYWAKWTEAAEACYEFTPATSGSAPSNGDVINGTGSGGTMVAGTGQSYTANGLKFESSGDYRYVTVTLDNNLKEGSVIAVTMWMDGTSSNRGLYLQTSAGTQKAEWKFTADSENHQYSYTVEAGDGLINTNVFRLARINNVYLKSVTVSNCGDAACSTPTTAFGNGAYTVGGSALDLSTLISGKQGSGAITYTVKNANGTGATIAGSSFTATSAGTATVTATQAADATYCEKVMDATITVSAAGPSGDCDMYFWFNATADATTAGVTNNEGGFFGSVPGSSANTVSGSITIDGTTYNVTQRTSNTKPSITFTVPSGKTGKLYAIVNGSSDRSVILKQGSTTIQSITWENDCVGHDFDAVPAGTYTITSSGNMGWCMLAVKVCDALTPCTTPVIPSLSDQTVCPGSDIAAWDATQTASLETGETATYSWKKKGSETVLGTSATLDLGSSATESQSGTYVVTVTVSADGKASTSASAEVDLTVTAAVEEPSISSNKATVYAGNSVTLTATCGTAGVTWNWYKCTAADGSGAGSSLGTSSSYTIASAPAAGTYYYKAVATGTCGSAEHVYTLTVSAASECENYYWFVYAADAETNGVVNNRDGFFSNTSTGTGNTGTYTMTVDGVSMTGTKRLSTAAYAPKFTVPAGATATLYIYGKAASSDAGKHLVLKRTSDDEEVEVTSNTTVQGYTKEDIEPGEWTLSCGSSNWCYSFFAVKVCSTSSCTDATPTIAAANTTVCVGTELSITATSYETSPTSIQWQKLNGSTWDNISGATEATYTVASATSENAGSYRVVVTKGCARTSNTVTIAVPSAPVFGDVPASVSVMQTIALSINTVEATDATKYRWFKSADDTWDAGDVEIGTNKELIKAYDGEAIGNPSYYIFCRAQNACGTTTSTAIAVNVTAYVEEDCATKGNEGDAEFDFTKESGVGESSVSSQSCWTSGGKAKYLTYTAPDGKYFDKAKVTVAVSSGSVAAYGYSTDGSSYTYANLTGLSSALAEKTIDLPANVTHFRIGRNFDPSYGVTSGTFYLRQVCFEYTEACTATTVTPSTSSVNYEMGGAWSNPTFTLSVAGTLTYSSSNEDIASVDDDGTVTFNGEAGTVTITASYAGGTISATEYCASSGSYTINVSCPGGAPKVVADGSVDMSGCNSSVTLLAKTQADGDFADGTYQWFRNGEEIDGATSSSYTATQAGTYTVARTNTSDCTTPSTNSAVVTSETTEPEVERLVPFQYYHVNKTYTDQMKMRHLFAVKNSGTLDGRHFKMYVSRNGGAATDVTSSNALVVVPNGDGHVDTVMVDLNKLSGKYSENDELVFTCKAIDCSSNVSDVYKNTITMNVIGSTPTLALICSGSNEAGGTRDTKKLTVGGDFITGYNKADLCEQTGNTSFDANIEWGLYTDLKANYIVTPVNGYAVFNKLNYEPFDILLLTDYPKSKKSEAAQKVIDDMADLCDYRPLLSFKTHFRQVEDVDWDIDLYTKWVAKGFTTAPVADTKNDGKLNLNIVCYAHPMFEAIKTGADVYEDAENTSAPLVYKMLTGEGYEKNKGMQGFEIAAAENFVTIGLTHHDAAITYNSPLTGEATWSPNSGDRMLVTVAERQANIEARMILFSLNAGAQSKLTDKGELVVLKCLEYLLDTDPLHVADCSFTFDNGEGNERTPEQQAINCSTCPPAGDGKWSNPANWGPDYRLLPGEFTSVRIKKPVEVDMEHAHVMSVRILEDGQITIPAGKALDVKSTIRRMDGSEIYPTDVTDIHIGSASTGNGTLIFNNNTGDTKARVDMYSNAQADIANMSAATSVWQYIGTPHTDVANARSNYYGSWLYQYGSGAWEVIPNGGPLEAFRGYCITNETAPIVYDMAGTLAATTTQDIAIPAGYTVIANSWVAPIDINAITEEDMENITDKTIYFFNTGTDAEGEGTTEDGTYRAAPINSASYTGDWQIPSMQGFYISTTSDGTLHLDYDRHVRPTGSRSVVSNPMYAPRRAAAESEEPNVLKIFARGSRYQDKLVVLEREDFTRGYDSGWDGEAWGGGKFSPMVYVTGEGREDAVSAIPEFEGTVIAFKAGEDSDYHFDFIYDGEESLYLFDTENNTYTQIMTGNAYYFTTTDKAAHSRFILTRRGPQIETGIEPTSDGESAKARKLLIEDKMYILLNGMLYDATGKVVK